MKAAMKVIEGITGLFSHDYDPSSDRDRYPSQTIPAGWALHLLWSIQQKPD